VWADRSYALTSRFLTSVASVGPVAGVPALVALELALLGLFLAYLPWSHMTHFFAKYFTWHSVRWDDAPNVFGTAYAARMQKLLARPISWSAPHIRGDGRKSWADVAGERGDS
jgi:nitrate reductase gamma subunit